MITTGSQQALDLIGKILINPGDKILVELPTYLGALAGLERVRRGIYRGPGRRKRHAHRRAWKPALRAGPKLIYVLPNFQNPTGVTLSLERRKQLIELADKYGVPIVEDDPYGRAPVRRGGYSLGHDARREDARPMRRAVIPETSFT